MAYILGFGGFGGFGCPLRVLLLLLAVLLGVASLRPLRRPRVSARSFLIVALLESERFSNSAKTAEYWSPVTSSCNSRAGSVCASSRLWFILRRRTAFLNSLSLHSFLSASLTPGETTSPHLLTFHFPLWTFTSHSPFTFLHYSSPRVERCFPYSDFCAPPSIRSLPHLPFPPALNPLPRRAIVASIDHRLLHSSTSDLFFCDGSRKRCGEGKKRSGYGVVAYRGNSVQGTVSVGIGRQSSVSDAGMFALAHSAKQVVLL